MPPAHVAPLLCLLLTAKKYHILNFVQHHVGLTHLDSLMSIMHMLLQGPWKGRAGLQGMLCSYVHISLSHQHLCRLYPEVPFFLLFTGLVMYPA